MKEDIYGYKLGADDYIQKPFDSEVLLLNKSHLNAMRRLTVKVNMQFDLGRYHSIQNCVSLNHDGKRKHFSKRK